MPDHTNRLVAEKSPYLLQHAHNPVDWYPWGDEAFERARRDDKPVILSVGYSTCHWCHVMEEESFSDPEIAQVMNQHFVSVKVDREERPDIDAVYMNYVMASTGSGGWPMTVLLTPERKPFYGGTYFPPKDRLGLPGFQTLLLSAADAWRTRRSELVQSADAATQYLTKHGVAGEPAELGADTLENAFLRYEDSFDAENGGFGGAPKFPRSHALSFLFRYWRRMGVAKALSMAETTLRKMDDGGMHDALGGGFHRYSTDAYWRVPHFEKMLYDQALLARTYAEAYQITKNERYRRVTRDILDYVLREMSSPEGGFFSAQDADSADAEGRKREGAFYVWRKKDVHDALGVSEADIFCFHYGVEENGNALNDPHEELAGQNTLYVAHSLEETAARFDRSAAQIAKSLESSRAMLRELRSKRPAPTLDDKILADWNGLMIAAFAFASRVFEDAAYRDAAARAAGFVLSAMREKKGRLFHRYRQGNAAITGNLNDHAFMVYGLLALYEASFDPRWLEAACGIADRMMELFGDDAAGGFFLTAKDAEALIARPKEIYDGAVPSGNSMAALGLVQLYAFTGREKYSAAADATLKTFSSPLSTDPSNTPQMLMALDFVLGPSSEVVIAEGDPTELGDDMTRAIYSRFNPNQVVLRKGAGAAAAALERLAPFTAGQKPIGGKTAAFFCRRHACTLPVTDAAALAARLDAETPSTVKKGGNP